MTVPGLTVEQANEFREAFQLFDKDDSGKINISELGSVMRSLGIVPTEKEINELIEQSDLDNSSSMELDEFLIMMSKHLLYSNDENELKEVFKVFAKTNPEYITVSDLRYIMSTLGEKLTEDELTEMINAADKSGQGKVSYEDFVLMLTTN